MKKPIFLLVVTIFVVAFSLFRSGSTSTPKEMVGNLRHRLEYPRKIFAMGRIEGATPEVVIRPQLPGRVIKVHGIEGQFVDAGYDLLQLDETQYHNEMMYAKANVHLVEAQLQMLKNGARNHERNEAVALYRAKLAQLENARREWERADELRQAEAISKREADDLRAQFDTLRSEVDAARAHMEKVQAPAREDEIQIAEARVMAARARLDVANENLKRMTVRALSSGQILKVSVQVGELAGPESSEPVFIIADTSSLLVSAFVEELDAPQVKVGMPANITADGLPGKTFEGTVTSVSPRMSRKILWSDRPDERRDTKTREIKIAPKNPEGLFIGLRVDVTIEFSDHLQD